MDTENRAAWEDAMIDGTGQSRDEVRETAAKMARFDELMKKKANGEVLTPQEQAEFNRLDRDEEVRRGIETRRRIQQHQMDQTPESASKYSNLDGSISDGVESRNLVYSDGGQAGNLIRQTNSVASEVTNDGNSLPRGTTSMAFNAQSGAAQSNSQNVVELSAAQPQQPVAANGVQRVASVAITFDSAMM
jgi:hypothetical protein